MGRRKIETATTSEPATTTANPGPVPEPDDQQRAMFAERAAAATDYADRMSAAQKAIDSLHVEAAKVFEGALPSAKQERGQEFEASWPEEAYGKPGSFSSYRVGPFRAKGHVMPGETLPQAFERVMADLAVVAAKERIRARDAFLAHFEVAFTKG